MAVEIKSATVEVQTSSAALHWTRRKLHVCGREGGGG